MSFDSYNFHKQIGNHWFRSSDLEHDSAHSCYQAGYSPWSTPKRVAKMSFLPRFDYEICPSACLPIGYCFGTPKTLDHISS